MTSDIPEKVAKDVGDRARDTPSNTASTVKATAGKVGDTVRDLAARTGDAAGDIYDDASGRVREAVDRLPNPSEAVAAGRRAYAQGNRTVGRHVSKQPLEALLLAGAIGYLVGWAANRS